MAGTPASRGAAIRPIWSDKSSPRPQFFERLMNSSSQSLPVVYVLVFNSGREDEGIYTISSRDGARAQEFTVPRASPRIAGAGDS